MAEAAIPSTGENSLTPVQREKAYQRNFLVFLSDYLLFSLAYNLIGPTTVIPDFVRKLTDSEVLIALSSQMFEILWLMPQLLVARSLMRVKNKKWWFVGPNIPVRTMIVILAGVVVLVGPDHPHQLLIAFFIFYGLLALGDGVVGVPWVDLLGSSLDARRRARLFGLGNALVGVGVLGIAPIIRYVLGDSGPDFPNNYALLFLLAGLGFIVTIPACMLIRELPGGTPRETTPPLREYLPDLLRVLRQDRPFRTMLSARVLMTFYTMAAPFYIGFATERLNMESGVAVSHLLLMQTFGNVSASLVYSRLADRHNLQFIRLGMLFGVVQPVLALLAGGVGPAPLYVAFLASGVVTGWVSQSFINWVIGYATSDERPVYSGLFNSTSAIGLLIAPVLGGLLVEAWGYEAVFIIAMVMMAAALVVVLRHRDAARPVTGGVLQS